jgi:hypothetical protein
LVRGGRICPRSSAFHTMPRLPLTRSVTRRRRRPTRTALPLKKRKRKRKSPSRLAPHPLLQFSSNPSHGGHGVKWGDSAHRRISFLYYLAAQWVLCDEPLANSTCFNFRRQTACMQLVRWTWLLPVHDVLRPSTRTPKTSRSS